MAHPPNSISAQEVIVHPLKGKIPFDELEESELLLILSSMTSLGSVKIRQLLNYFGSAKLALLADPKEIASMPGFGPKIISQWTSWKHDTAWRRNLELADKEGAKLIPLTDSAYPKRLMELPDPPMILYAKGDVSKLSKKAIAIVGTRQASIYGNEMATLFANELAGMGFVVLSGLARGIDTAAHNGALESGSTVAVIGSGLSDIYPAENRPLADSIAKNGCLLSEFPMATPPDRLNFPQRNRIVSALSMGILLIEAPVKSGAMITMHHGYGLGRKLFALPGRVDNKNFCGNHALIKTGQAVLVETAAEIAGSFEDLFSGSRSNNRSARARIQLDKEEQELLQSLPIEEITIEEIAGRTLLPMATLNVLLMSLLLKGAIKEFPGKVYKKTGF